MEKKVTPLVMKNRHHKPSNVEKPATQKDIKKPFVRKPHLNQKPFNNVGLKAFRDEIARKNQPNYKIRKK